MSIFDEKRMEQKPIYPTKQTPSYADWALFEMGKELEESGSGGEAYTAGSGISISEENVISNIAQPDVNKAYVDGVDINLQQQIDAIVSASDVKDVVATYAELQAYDTTTLGNNDIIKVMQDSTHDNAITYYRWVITEGVGAWTYIGSQGPYYTKSQTDALLNDKLDDDFGNADVGSATAGQVLTVNSSANGVEFAPVPKELPAIASGDAGKVLQVNSGETGVEWASIATSAGYEYYTSYSNTNTIPGYSYLTHTINTDINYDYIIVARTSSFTCSVNNVIYLNTTSTQNNVNIQNHDHGQVSVGRVTFFVFRKYRGEANHDVIIIGSAPSTVDGLSAKSLKLIPGVQGNANKKLSVNNSGTALEFQTVNEVPTPTASDVNKVLTATAANAFAWMASGGGSGSSFTRVTDYSQLSSGDYVFCSLMHSVPDAPGSTALFSGFGYVYDDEDTIYIDGAFGSHFYSRGVLPFIQIPSSGSVPAFGTIYKLEIS